MVWRKDSSALENGSSSTMDCLKDSITFSDFFRAYRELNMVNFLCSVLGYFDYLLVFGFPLG